MKRLTILIITILANTSFLKSQTGGIATTEPEGFATKQYWKTQSNITHLLIETNIPYNLPNYATITLKGSEFANIYNPKNLFLQISWNAEFGLNEVFSNYYSDGDVTPQIQFIETNGFLSILLFRVSMNTLSLELDLLAHKNESVLLNNSWFTNWKFSSDDGSLPHPNSLYIQVEDWNYSNYVSKKLYTETLGTAVSNSSSTVTSYSQNSVSGTSQSNSFNINAGNNNSLSFWGRNISRGFEPYSITMSDRNQWYAGRVAGETNSDFNMYFRMTDQAARGFNFQNGPGNNVAGIDGAGNGRFIGSLFANQNLAVGVTTVPVGYRMIVDGRIGARQIKITTSTTWADFVFNKNYKLLPLTELEKYIKANKHLPDIPTTEEVQKNGVDIGEIQIKLLQKVEELTLHLIEQEKKINALEALLKLKKRK